WSGWPARRSAPPACWDSCQTPSLHCGHRKEEPMRQLILAMAASAIGVCATLVLVRALGWGRDGAERGATGDRLRLTIEAQSAELRRLSDAEARRDLGGEQLRAEVLALREALVDLRARD